MKCNHPSDNYKKGKIINRGGKRLVRIYCQICFSFWYEKEDKK